MASRGDIKKESLQPVLNAGWKTIDFKSTLDKAGDYVKLKSNQFLAEGDIPVIDQGEKFISGYVNDNELRYKGELPIIIFGDHTRNIKYVDFTFAVGADGTKIIKPKSFFHSKFYYYYLRSLNIPSLGYSRHYKILSQIDIPVLSKQYQQRITDKLDKLFSHHDTLNERLNKLPVLLKKFRERVLNQAMTGELTKNWRAHNNYSALPEINDIKKQRLLDNPKTKFKECDEESVVVGWQRVFLEEVFDIQTGSTPRRGVNKYWDNGNIPWLKSGQVNNKDIIEADEFITEVAIKETNTKLYPVNSVLIALYGEGKTRGQVGILKFKAASNQAIAAMVNPKLPFTTINFIFYFGLSQYQEIRKQATGGNQPNLNVGKIKAWVIDYPPLEEQKEIVRKVEELFAIADKIKDQYNQLKNKIDKLPGSLLEKAFKGELVVQDENDEPASILLERINLTRAKKETKVETAVTFKKATTINLTKMKKQPEEKGGGTLQSTIKKYFNNKQFTFEELNQHLESTSMEQYIINKKEFFELLRNHKLRRGTAKLISEYNERLNILTFKLDTK